MTNRSLAALRRTTSLIAALSPSLVFAQDVDNDRHSSKPAPHAIYWGMDATFVRARMGTFPGQNQIVAPTQSLRISTSIGKAFRIEAPLMAAISSSSFFGTRTEISTGLLFDVFPGRLSGRHHSNAQTGFFIGGGPLFDYLSYDDDETTYGFAGRAGYELALDVIHVRAAALYERHFEKEKAFRTRRYGGIVGFSYPIAGDQRTNVGETGSWYIETRMGVNSQKVENSETSTALFIPKPFLSVFHFPGSQRRTALGLRTNLQYDGDDTFSFRAVQLTPRVEINVFPASFSRRGMQIGAHARVQHYKSSLSMPGLKTETQTYKYYGAGGDVSLTLPMMPTMWKFGVGFDHDFAGAHHLRPAFNTLRFDVAIDRYLIGGRKTSDK